MMSNVEIAKESGPSRLLVGGAGVLALFSASCCVLPIGLSIIGLGGAWLTALGPFVAHRIEILVVVGIVLAWAWLRFFRRRACRRRTRSTVVLLSLTTMAFALAASSPLWEQDAAQAMVALWRQTR